MSSLESPLKEPDASPEPAYRAVGPGVRFVVSALVGFHALAVFWAPFHFSTVAPDGFTSPATQSIRGFIDPYIGLLYLDHGYFFFAPNPGPSHLIRYEVEFTDGRKESGQLPDRDSHWPRLLYHRHFMVAEYFNDLYAPPDEPKLDALRDGATAAEQRAYQRRARDFEETVVAPWRRRRAEYVAMRSSLEKHIRSVHSEGGEIERVTIKRIQHELYYPAEGERKIDLRQARSYVELPETSPSERTSWSPQQPEPVPSRP